MHFFLSKTTKTIIKRAKAIVRTQLLYTRVRREGSEWGLPGVNRLSLVSREAFALCALSLKSHYYLWMLNLFFKLSKLNVNKLLKI